MGNKNKNNVLLYYGNSTKFIIYKFNYLYYENSIVKEINIIWKEIIIVYKTTMLCQKKEYYATPKKKRVVYNICF